MTILSEANRIKARLWACTTVAEVEQVAEEERATVMSWTQTYNIQDLVLELKQKPDEGGLMFLHIINLKSHMLKHQVKPG